MHLRPNADPLIHLLLAEIAGYPVARALYSGEVGLNASRYKRREAPIR